MTSKKIKAVALILSTALLLSGCGSKEIFADPNAKYRLKGVSDEELEKDTYYVKDAATFYPTYMPEGTATGKTNTASSSRILWTEKDYNLIPTYYKNEFLAYSSSQTSLSNIPVERFKDLGYSIGVYGAVIDEDGYVAFSVKQNCIKNSNIQKTLKSLDSDMIRVVSINDQDVTPYVLYDGGIFAGMEQDGVYELGLYAGTKYQKVMVQADRRFFTSYEIYNINRAEDTKNGYLTINMPEDCKCGYYVIDGSGMYKYYDTTKSETKDDQDMNEPFYVNAADQLNANSQQYVISVPTAATEATFSVRYNTDVVNDEEVLGILTAPDGTTYEMEHGTGLLSIAIESVMSGRWTINIIPRSLEILDVEVNPVYKEQDATQESFELIMPEDTNITFSIGYEGDGEVWGTITYEDGSAHELELDEKEKKLTYTYSYVKEGKYVVEVYHYADTKIDDEVTTYDDEEALEEEIISIEG